MGIIYEINPPKILIDDKDDDLKNKINELEERVSEISSVCDGIHLTDSVLGIKRVSPIEVATLLKRKYPRLRITISLRVRDKNKNTLEKIVKKAISVKIDGILIVKGDPSKDSMDSGLVPSKVVKCFKTKFKDKMNFYLSLPSNPDFIKIQKKIESKPIGFFTQVIESTEQVSKICNKLKPKGFRIIPCVLLPSHKNEKSAKFLNIDWSPYSQNPISFINKIHQIADDVLITSPNDFVFAKQILADFHKTKYSALG